MIYSLISIYIITFKFWGVCICVFLKRFYLFTFRERGREGEREGEKHQCIAAPRVPPIGFLGCNTGLSPDWQSNQRNFGLQAGTQSTEPQQPGLFLPMHKVRVKILFYSETKTHIHYLFGNFFSFFLRGKCERSPPLPQIMHLHFRHLGNHRCQHILSVLQWKSPALGKPVRDHGIFQPK